MCCPKLRCVLKVAYTFYFDNHKIDQEQSSENCEFANAVSLLQCNHFNFAFILSLQKK